MTASACDHVDDGLSPPDKVRLMCEYFQESKPTHRTKCIVPHPRTGNPVVFLPGKFLNNLTNQVLNGKSRSLTCEHISYLRELEWFQNWIAGVHNQRLVGQDGGRPSVDEEALLVAEHFPHHLPARGEVVEVERGNGEPYKLNPSAVLDKIAINWHEESHDDYLARLDEWKRSGVATPQPRKRAATKFSKIDAHTKKNVETCAWFASWFNQGVQRREVAKMRKVVTKEMKLDLLMRHYMYTDDGLPKKKPTTSDSISVVLENNEHFRFYPTTFMDDIVDNWVDCGKPGVVLSPEQRKALEKLPWFLPWLKSVFLLRSRRKRKLEHQLQDPAEESYSFEPIGSKPQTPEHV